MCDNSVEGVIILAQCVIVFQNVHSSMMHAD